MNANQYSKLNELLSEFSTLEASFEQAEAEIKLLQLAAAKELLPKHAALKTTLANIESRLREISDAHYHELFGADDKRTHSTPFGGLKYTKSRSLEFDDAEKVVLKIKIECARETARIAGSNTPDQAPRFSAALLIRTHEAPNLLAMESMDDATLSLFGVRRVTKDTFKVVPFKMASDRPAKTKKGMKEAA